MRRLQRKLACHRPCPLGPAPEEWLTRATKVRRPDSQTLKPRLKASLEGDRKRCERIPRLRDVATDRAPAYQRRGPVCHVAPQKGKGEKEMTTHRIQVEAFNQRRWTEIYGICLLHHNKAVLRLCPHSRVTAWYNSYKATGFLLCFDIFRSILGKFQSWLRPVQMVTRYSLPCISSLKLSAYC